MQDSDPSFKLFNPDKFSDPDNIMFPDKKNSIQDIVAPNDDDRNSAQSIFDQPGSSR